MTNNKYYDVVDCRINPNGLYLKLYNDRRGEYYELYNVKLNIERMEEDIRLFTRGRRQRELQFIGTFYSQHPCNQIKADEPLELTLEDIENKFGRKVKIVNKVNKKEGD